MAALQISQNDSNLVDQFESQHIDADKTTIIKQQKYSLMITYGLSF